MTQDMWIRDLVNNGVPLCTGIAIDTQVANLLQAAGIEPTDPISTLKSDTNDNVSYIDPWKANEPEDVDDGLTYPCAYDVSHSAGSAFNARSGDPKPKVLFDIGYFVRFRLS